MMNELPPLLTKLPANLTFCGSPLLCRNPEAHLIWTNEFPFPAPLAELIFQIQNFRKGQYNLNHNSQNIKHSQQKI